MGLDRISWTFTHFMIAHIVSSACLLCLCWFSCALYYHSRFVHTKWKILKKKKKVCKCVRTLSKRNRGNVRYIDVSANSVS